MPFLRPITAIMCKRYSCRNYLKQPIESGKLSALQEVVQNLPPGPFGELERYALVAGTDEDRRALEKLSTYGFIRNPPAFIIGATRPAPLNLENFGYRMELIVLHATDLDLGTCWLGGTFSRSGFMHKIHAAEDETIAAVCAVGHINNDISAIDQATRLGAGAQYRKAWGSLFFDGKFGATLTPQAAGEYAEVLEMVRIGPSASNKQPWRIVKAGDQWHFYLQRTKGYRDWWVARLMGVADMQRIDMGIAMCHFALAAGEAGLRGNWQVNQPAVDLAANVAEYIITWNAEDGAHK
jgi:Putative TM nitroreductase